jgi:hypothetical protein
VVLVIRGERVEVVVGGHDGALSAKDSRKRARDLRTKVGSGSNEGLQVRCSRSGIRSNVCESPSRTQLASDKGSKTREEERKGQRESGS